MRSLLLWLHSRHVTFDGRLGQSAKAFVECVQTVKGDRQTITDCGDAIDYLLASRAVNSDTSKLHPSAVKELLTFLVWQHQHTQ